MGFTVTKTTYAEQKKLLDGWVTDAETRMNGLTDVPAVTYRKLTALGVVPSPSADLPTLLRFVDMVCECVAALLDACCLAPAEDERVRNISAQVSSDGARMKAAKDDEGRLTALQDAFNGYQAICAAALKKADAYRGLNDCRNVIAQIRERGDSDLLILNSDGKPQAVASVQWGKAVFVSDLAILPEVMQQGTRGIGKALMEWVARKAKEANGSVRLQSLSLDSTTAYLAWGFQLPSGALELADKHLDIFLANNTTFANLQ